jgi:methylmalonic aciduria homocystinuria type C protein
VEGAVDAALAPRSPRPRAEIRFAPEPPPRRVAMQRLAHVAGLAWLAPSHLCVHPRFGPWIALRAAVVIDVEGPPPQTPIAAPCDCATGCQPAFDRALAAGTPRDQAELRERWRLWLAVRDACPVGRAHRYDDDQIRYHYAGDRPG